MVRNQGEFGGYSLMRLQVEHKVLGASNEFVLFSNEVEMQVGDLLILRAISVKPICFKLVA